MKIAFIGQKGLPAKSGGVEKHAEELAVRMAERGHDVFAYVRKDHTDKEIMQYKGVTLVRVPNISSKGMRSISHTFFSIAHAVFQRYDVVHIHSASSNSLNFLVKIFMPKTVLVGTYYCQDYFRQKWGGFSGACLRFGEHMACKVPDRTIAVTNILKNMIQERFGYEADMISNGANVSWNGNSDRLVRWNLTKGKYILAVSRLIRRKGLHYLIEAFKELERDGLAQGNKLVIVGKGFYATDYVKYLKKLAGESENIIFTGAQFGENMSQLFSHACFFVQPSDSESLSVSLLEAMGYGLATIVSNIPENMESVGEAGIYFSQGNVSDLRDKMADLIADKERNDNLSEAGKARVLETYNWDSIADQTEILYKEEMDKKSNKQFHTQKSNI